MNDKEIHDEMYKTINEVPALLKKSTFVKDMVDFTEEEILDSLNTAPFQFQQEVTNETELWACLQSVDYYGHELPISIHRYVYKDEILKRAEKKVLDLIIKKYEKQNIAIVNELLLCRSKDLIGNSIIRGNLNWLKIFYENGLFSEVCCNVNLPLLVEKYGHTDCYNYLKPIYETETINNKCLCYWNNYHRKYGYCDEDDEEN